MPASLAFLSVFLLALTRVAEGDLVMTPQGHVLGNVTEFRVGVIIISESGAPYDIERAGAAIDLAFEKVNQDILNASYRMVQIQRRYGPACDAEKAPGWFPNVYANASV